jgi:Na+-transporting NADH:ubiquinone oxidoreductase subunit NqrC
MNMWRKKKFIIIAVLTMVVLAGILGGVAIANADDQNTNQTQADGTKLLDKVAEIYQKNTNVAIDSQELQKAFTEARNQITTDARNQYFQKLVEDGKITQEQLDAYNKWMESRPSFPTDELNKWMESRPDIPYLFGSGNRGGMMPFGGGSRGFGKFGGMFGGRFGGWCPPAATTK